MMSEFTQPKIIPIENRPQKSKVFIKCIVAPIVIFLIMAKVFSFGWFGSLFFGIWLLWFVITYYFYEYGNTYFINSLLKSNKDIDTKKLNEYLNLISLEDTETISNQLIEIFFSDSKNINSNTFTKYIKDLNF